MQEKKQDFLVKLWSLRQEIPTLKKSTKGFKFLYTDLVDIMEVVTPLLNKHKIAFQHTTRVIDGENLLITSVFSLDDPVNDSVAAELKIPDGVALGGMNPYQSLGSALTYFRRYHLLTLLGIITDDDTDASKGAQTGYKTDYVTKVKTLIGSGKHTREKMEQYYNKTLGLMTDDQKVECKALIKKIK